MDSVNCVEKEVENVISKFNYIDKHTANSLQELIATLEGVKRSLQGGVHDSQQNNDVSISQCVNKIKDTILKLSSEHKDLHACVSKVGRSIDKNFTTDFNTIYVEDAFDAESHKEIGQAINEHLLQCGMLDVADTLMQEAGLEMEEEKKEPFLQMHHVLEALKCRDLQPALNWVELHRDKLTGCNSCLEFKLHKLRFIQFLQQGILHQWDAIQYAHHFAPFGYSFKEEIQVLMGSLLYVGQGLENSPYCKLVESSLWDEITDIFMKESCKVMGLPAESSLSTVIKAGCLAIPPLLSVKQIMLQGQFSGVWSANDELPLEIDLGKDCMFHSVFACPILRQQSTDANPPVRLICGHVISQDALNKLSSGNKWALLHNPHSSHKVKCPYCPMEQSSSDARLIFF